MLGGSDKRSSARSDERSVRGGFFMVLPINTLNSMISTCWFLLLLLNSSNCVDEGHGVFLGVCRKTPWKGCSQTGCNVVSSVLWFLGAYRTCCRKQEKKQERKQEKKPQNLRLVLGIAAQNICHTSFIDLFLLGHAGNQPLSLSKKRQVRKNIVRRVSWESPLIHCRFARTRVHLWLKL